ncbi:MAG: DUF1156 domain-containing protein, partial [Candidatus Pacebacteria bacterium]|nr:DUF1156 domain-containing protein [Candidatus Paceibacterota bacterium]
MNKSFIETQFPVSKISKESYKERKAVQGQTLTGIGKWWGRKPLILVRATILGLLLPATENPQKDREIFLKILSMDDDGLWQRKEKSVPAKDLYDIANTSERNKYFILQEEVPKWNASISNIEKEAIQKSLFEKMSYDQKITYCIRPEELVNLNASTWVDINSYLGTTATNLQELMEQLSILRYGNLVTVGDCFSGGGSVPFEAARIGLKAYGSDLNPVATLLSWAALNINGSTDDEVEQLRIFQKKVYDVVDSQITTWGVEHNEQGDRANSYLYCNETKCPACDWVVPMAPSWVIGEGPTRTIAVLKPNNEKKCFDIEVHQDVSSSELKEAENSGTISREGLSCPYCRTISPISSVRHDRKDSDGVKISGLRQWGKTDFYPNVNDIFQERLYCIRYEKKLNGKTSRYYTAPTNQDLLREKKVISLIADNLTEWQKNGYIPSDKIDSGYNTDQPIRERGWQYWHQLFNPRQLLIVGLLLQKSMELAKTKKEIVVGILGVNHNANWNSKLSRWDSGKSPSVKDTFSNQALNTLY